MKRNGTKCTSAALPFMVLALSVMLSATGLGFTLQAPAAGGGGAQPGALQGAGQGRGGARGARGGGGGGARGTPLGDGPWDIGEGENRVHVTVVTKGLDHPWGMAFLPNGEILVTERGVPAEPHLRVIRNGVLDPKLITGLPEIRARTLGGLLDIAIHPKFSENHWVYLAYSKPGADDPADAATAVYRARWDGGYELTEGKDIFVAEPHFGGGPRGSGPTRCCGQGPADGSYGSRLAFDKDGYLYVTVGDRNYGELAQDPSADLGKIVRLKDDGTIPSDNPFVGKDGYRPENLHDRPPQPAWIDDRPYDW